jgi:nucleotide-binding universal stress UspA family protein
MYNNILVPLDGSKVAEAVLPYTKFLAGALNLAVDLIHVHDPETVAPSMHSSREADYLKKVANSFLGSLTVHCHVKDGAAAEMILDTASANASTLIAMATHGQSGGERWLLGHVAQKVLQASKNPLVLIRPNAEMSPSSEVNLSTVIVPLDGSHLAEQIFPHVVYLAMKLGLQVVLIRTYHLPTASYFMAAHVSPPDISALREKIKKEAGEYLDLKAAELRSKGLVKVSFAVAEGGGPDEIIDLAQRSPDSIVAMSTHGRSGIGRWVLGSVADRVVSYSGGPVLVIRPVLPTK